MPCRLQGQVILNTRPAHQQAGLTDLLQADGAVVLSFPVIAIEPGGDAALLRSLSARLGDFDLLLFVSRNAVDGALRAFDFAKLDPAAKFGVIGGATHQALAAALAGSQFDLRQCEVAGEPYNSESLLDSPALKNVGGQRILILRGQQGRNLLGDELAARGALVEYAEVYRRALPEADFAAFNELVSGAFPTLVVLTSGEGMHNLLQLVDDRAAQALRRVPWLLISERMRESAQNLGHNAAVLIARNASDSGIRQTICEWADQRQ